MENVYKALENVIDCIKNSSDYQTCIALKEQMNQNDEIKEIVSRIKTLQKKYVQHYDDSSISEELDTLEKRLLEIPIYSIYSNHLEKVNERIEYLKDTLNDYFYQLLNEKY